MTELNDVVDDLTLPKNVKIETDDGFTWATEDALLVQLREAVSSSLNSGSGAGGSPSTRNVLDGDALHKATVITSQIGDWCHMAGMKGDQVTRDPVTDLRAWQAAFLARDEPEEFYIGQMRAWAAQIRAMVNPPKVIEITAPCPVCGEGSYVNDMGERITNPLALTYRPDSDHMWKNSKVLCRACDAVWIGGDAMEELADELNDKETA
ncbi:hypothetical protein [Microbacterium sp. NPDC087592]|uniref:DUF7341 domain-containing protein n=1 Tax=Microbacterium sp. NPDC087592 TaxID=3364193 RepID=UPI0038119517